MIKERKTLLAPDRPDKSEHYAPTCPCNLKDGKVIRKSRIVRGTEYTPYMHHRRDIESGLSTLELRPFPPSIYIEEPTFSLPEGIEVPNPEYVVPDQVLERAIDRWGMALASVRMIDPFCGTGRFPDMINRRGGCCDAIELLPTYYQIAQRYIAPGSVPVETNADKYSQDMRLHVGGRIVASEVLQGDLRFTQPPLGYPRKYHGVYTSPPFAILDKPEIVMPLLLTIGEMPSKGGFIVIDSASKAIRDEVLCDPASQTIHLMQKVGYALRDRLDFETPERPGFDSQFSELYFKRFGEF